MLQIIFLVIGLCIIVLTLSFVFKRYARTILWSSAIALFAGTLLLVGIGVIILSMKTIRVLRHFGGQS